MIQPIAGICKALAASLVIVGTISSFSQPSLPASFQARTIHSPAGAEILVRFGGGGPVVLLLHGYAENSDSWAPLAADLMKDHTVVVPDLRGIGRSSVPTEATTKKRRPRISAPL
jgi:pimeloyl-ACP methyl ester carboxylesterase